MRKIISKAEAKKHSSDVYNEKFERHAKRIIDNGISEAVKEGAFCISLGAEFWEYKYLIKQRYRKLGFKVRYPLLGDFTRFKYITLSWK